MQYARFKMITALRQTIITFFFYIFVSVILSNMKGNKVNTSLRSINSQLLAYSQSCMTFP